MKAGLAANLAGKADAETALAPGAYREELGYGAYQVKAKQFMLPG